MEGAGVEGYRPEDWGPEETRQLDELVNQLGESYRQGCALGARAVSCEELSLEANSFRCDDTCSLFLVLDVDVLFWEVNAKLQFTTRLGWLHTIFELPEAGFYDRGSTTAD